MTQLWTATADTLDNKSIKATRKAVVRYNNNTDKSKKIKNTYRISTLRNYL